MGNKYKTVFCVFHQKRMFLKDKEVNWGVCHRKYFIPIHFCLLILVRRSPLLMACKVGEIKVCFYDKKDRVRTR